MALQLLNVSNTTMLLYPGMPVCQLMLIALVEEPQRSYGTPGLDSKYTDDDGGPSYWWRDRLVRLSVFFVRPYTVGHWVVWALTLVAALGAAWAVSRRETWWLTSARLSQLRGRVARPEPKRV